MSFLNDIKAATRQLYPTGRAFRMPEGGDMEKMHDGLAVSENQAVEDSVAIFDHLFPDNANFLATDAERWEQRLGMISNASVSLADRKAAIIRKMNHPGSILARQSHDYLQDRLQAAGFDVWIHENIPEQTPAAVLEAVLGLGEMGTGEMGELEMGSAAAYYPLLFTFSEMGELEMGGGEMGGVVFNQMVANHINEIADSFFDISPNYRSTFFVGGQILGTFADIDVNRKDEFRQLILRIKPAQSVGLLFINYI